MFQEIHSTTNAVDAAAFVDTHCHLDDDSFASDLDAVMDRSRELGVSRWINVGFNPDRWQPSIDLADRFPGMSFMLGVHPGDARRWSDTVHADLKELMERVPPVAIGEIGLDFYRGETNVEQQVTAFQSQLDLALERGLPAAIHMRSAESLVLEVIKSRYKTPPLLFHSYDGSDELTGWILANDAYVGVGGLATRTKSHHIHKQLRRFPLDRLLLETDSPYLVPNGFKHRRNTPESIPRIAAFVASLLDTEAGLIASQTTRNAERFFERLPPP
ncbi:MAG: TatD family hydrolase [Chloroflexota bacterium]|nr:TatD family hydrolase [Chloroflexota bacterium]